MTKILLLSIIFLILPTGSLFASNATTEETEKLGWTTRTDDNPFSIQINDEYMIADLQFRFTSRLSRLGKVIDTSSDSAALMGILSNQLAAQLTTTISVLNSATKNSEMFDALGLLGDLVTCHRIILWKLNHECTFTPNRQRIYNYDIDTIHQIIDYVYTVCDEKFIRSTSLNKAASSITHIRQAYSSIEHMERILFGRPTPQDQEDLLRLNHAAGSKKLALIINDGIMSPIDDAEKTPALKPLVKALKEMPPIDSDNLDAIKKQLDLLIKDTMLNQASIEKIAE